MADYLMRLLCGVCDMAAAPTGVALTFNVLPVDTAARVTLDLILDSSAPNNACYHIANPAGSTSVSELLTYCRSFGYTIQQEPFAKWCAHLTFLLRHCSYAAPGAPHFRL